MCHANAFTATTTTTTGKWSTTYSDAAVRRRLDSLLKQKSSTTSFEGTSSAPRDPLMEVSRADRRDMLIMQVVEAARFQRQSADPRSSQHRALAAHSAWTPKSAETFLNDSALLDLDEIGTKSSMTSYSLTTPKSLLNLISDIKTLLNPKLAKDYTATTVSQVGKLGLYQASLFVPLKEKER